MQIAAAPTITRAPSAPSAGDTAAPETAGADSFASLLDQRTRETGPADADENPAAEPQQDPQTARQDRSARPRTPAKPAARPAERTGVAKTDGPTEPGPLDETRRDASADAAPDPALQDWLAALHLPAPVAPPPAAASADAGTAASSAPGLAAVDLGAQAARALAPAPDGAASRETAAGSRGSARDKVTAAAPRAPSVPSGPTGTEPTPFSVAPADSARLSIDTRPSWQTSPTDAPMLPAGAHAPHGPSDRGTMDAVAVPMATPLADPQFPRAFGVQVSVLARDGVQQAELHLNPAEMGPVSVQIVMEGTQARIDFGADAAGTRQLIEHSLPELAAALREAGLTLSGGGVSQHSSGRDDGTGQASAGRHGDARAPGTAAADPATSPLRRTVRAGGVDLYA